MHKCATIDDSSSGDNVLPDSTSTTSHMTKSYDYEDHFYDDDTMDSEENTVTSWHPNNSENCINEAHTCLLLHAIKESNVQDDNNESSSINSSDNKEWNHSHKEIKDTSNYFSTHGLWILDNTKLRELHVAITNDVQEPMTFLFKWYPRINILKGNKSRKNLMSIDPKNWIIAENSMPLQHFKLNCMHEDTIKALTEAETIALAWTCVTKLSGNKK